MGCSVGHQHIRREGNNGLVTSPPSGITKPHSSPVPQCHRLQTWPGRGDGQCWGPPPPCPGGWGDGGDGRPRGPPPPCPQTPPTRPLGQLLHQGTSLQRLEPLPHVLSRSLRGFSWLDGASFFLVFIDFPSSDGARCVSPSPGHLGCFMFGNVNNAAVKVVDTFFCAD